MTEVEVKFEREGLTGIVPVETYLMDAAKRLGVRFEADCNREEGLHFCSVQLTTGVDNLSPLTQVETDYFAANGRRTNERLACQARIDKHGEVVIMTEEKKKTEDTAPGTDSSEQYRKDFTELPLEKKLANLVRLEAIALSETFSFVVNSPFQVFDKVMDVMAEFGLKKEENERNAARPEEHKTTTNGNTSTAPKAEKKKASKEKAAE